MGSGLSVTRILIQLRIHFDKHALAVYLLIVALMQGAPPSCGSCAAKGIVVMGSGLSVTRIVHRPLGTRWS